MRAKPWYSSTNESGPGWGIDSGLITEAPYNGEESEQRDFITEEMTSNLSNGTIEDNPGMEILRQPDSRKIQT